MRYITQVNRFHQIVHEKEISVKARWLYMAMLNLNNRLAWSEWFTASYDQLAKESGLGRATVGRAIRELKELGLIDGISGCKNGRREITQWTITPLEDRQPDSQSNGQEKRNIESQKDPVK